MARSRVWKRCWFHSVCWTFSFFPPGNLPCWRDPFVRGTSSTARGVRPFLFPPRGPWPFLPGVSPPSGTTLVPSPVSTPLWSPGFLCLVDDVALVALADSLTVVFSPPPSGEPGPLDLVGLPLTFGAYQGPLGFLSAVGSVCPPPFLRLSPGVDSTTFHPPGRNTLPDPGRTLLLFSLRENCNLRLLPTLLCGSVSCVSGLRKLSVVGD